MIYYVVQTYHKEVDEKYGKHMFPSYLTSYNMKLGGKDFGLQSGFYDALKFEKEADARLFMDKAIEIYGATRIFDIVPIDSRILGKDKILYIIEDWESQKFNRIFF